MKLPNKLQHIIDDFKELDSKTEKYEELMTLGKQLPSMPGELKTKENLVPGCQSTVHIYAEVIDGEVQLVADADSFIVKGLCAIFVEGLSGMQKDDLLNLEPDFIKAFGLEETLTPTRASASINIFNMIKKQVAEFP